MKIALSTLFHLDEGNEMISMNLPRRYLLVAALAPLFPTLAWAQPSSVDIEVWKSPACGCCTDWIAHLEKAGFRVTTHDSGNHAKRAQLGMPSKYGSCHTALLGGYSIEGHVPAPDIQRLLRDKPTAVGLAVPNMPVGSPGMDGPAYGDRHDPYDVLLVQADGTSRVYASYGGQRKK